MKFSNSAGVLIGLAFLVLALGFAADNPAAFINLPGLLIVVGGTFTAIFISFPVRDALAAFKQAKVLTEPVAFNPAADIERLVGFSKLWFRKQFSQIDEQLEQLNEDPFMQRGLQMVRDRQPYEDVMATLNWKISQYRARETAVINIFRSMSTFAPAFGMVGSLVGLVNMLQGVNATNLSGMTADMAIALITTFYGLLLANLVFKPIATKLEQRRNLKTIQLSMIAEGIAMLHQQRTPSAMQDTLFNFIQGQQDHVQIKASVPSFESAKGSQAASRSKSLMNKLGVKAA